MATYEATKYAHTGNLLTSLQAPNMADGTVTDVEFQYINTLSSNAQTQITASVPKAGATMTGSLVFPDSTGPAPAFIAMGAGTDIKVSSDGTSGLVIGNALEMQSTAAEKYLTATADGAVDVYHNNAKKIETSATGVTITGTAATTAVTGDGSGLTALNATNLGSGTVPDARFPSTLPATSGVNLTALNGSNIASGTVADARISALTSSKLTGALPAIDGSALTGVVSTTAGEVGTYAIAFYYTGASGSYYIAYNATTDGGNLIPDPSTATSTSEASTANSFYRYSTGSVNGTLAGSTLSGTWRCVGPSCGKTGWTSPAAGNQTQFTSSLFVRTV